MSDFFIMSSLCDSIGAAAASSGVPPPHQKVWKLMVYAWCLQGCGVTHSPSNLLHHPPARFIFRRCWDTAKHHHK